MGRGFPAALEQLILTARLICLFLFNVYISYLLTFSQFHGLGTRGGFSAANSFKTQSVQANYRHGFGAFFFRQYNRLKI